jgi:hypothetical protein
MRAAQINSRLRESSIMFMDPISLRTIREDYEREIRAQLDHQLGPTRLDPQSTLPGRLRRWLAAVIAARSRSARATVTLSQNAAHEVGARS